jgi:serine/threonine-protein kinase
MELDDLKQAWQTLDRRLEQQNGLQLALYRDGKLESLRRNLRPLVRGQVLQILFGAIVALLSVAFWTGHRHETHLLVIGLIMHAYGVVTMVAAGITLGYLSRIDYTAPVLTMQKQLAAARRIYVISGLCVGLPWWVLWVPATMLFFKGVFGADLYLYLSQFIWINVAIGGVGLLATWWFHRWSRQPSRPRLAKLIDDSMTGSSLRRAQGVLDEITRFERE